MNHRLALLALIISLASSRISCAITVGQIDDFQDGTLANWANGDPAAPQPMNIANGGPGGIGDRFLQILSTGIPGPGGRLTVFNRNQWLGDYIAAGVTAIEVDLRNTGTVTLSIRLAFRQDTNGGAPGYLSAAFILPADANWYHSVFLITPQSMIAINSPAPFDTFFTNPAELRIINEVGATNLTGDFIAAQLGIDNIRAVPEPAPWALFGIAGVPVALMLRRQRP
jgi:hypothetical protein